VAKATALDHLVEKLLHDGNAVVPRDHVLLKRQTNLALFHGLIARLQDALGDEDLAMNMVSQEDGFLITVNGEPLARRRDVTDPRFR